MNHPTDVLSILGGGGASGRGRAHDGDPWEHLAGRHGHGHDHHVVAPSPTYADDERHWQRYAPLVPAVDQLREHPPAEERWAWNGLSVHLDRLPVEQAPATLIVVHGIGGYGRLVIAPFGAFARAAGYEVVAPDLPGSGLTRCPRRRLDFPLWVDCLTALVERERDRADRPVVLFGLSLGGTLAYHAAARTPAVAALAATTLLDPRDPETRAGVARWAPAATLGLAAGRVPILDRVTVPVRWITKARGIANDPKLARLFLSDPLGGNSRLPLRFLRSLADTAPEVEPEDFHRPVLVLHPGNDRMTDVRFTRRFVDRLAGPAELVELPGCGHFPVEEPGASVLRERIHEILAAVPSPR